MTAPGARGCVASRDFITLRHWKMKDDTYIAASASIDYPGVPAKSDYIRYFRKLKFFSISKLFFGFYENMTNVFGKIRSSTDQNRIFKFCQ